MLLILGSIECQVIDVRLPALAEVCPILSLHRPQSAQPALCQEINSLSIEILSGTAKGSNSSQNRLACVYTKNNKYMMLLCS